MPARRAALGLESRGRASETLIVYDNQIRDRCPTGCDAGDPRLQAPNDLRDRAHTKNIVALSLFAVGGAVVASGVALVILNQPRTVRAQEQAHAAVTPMVGPGVVGLSLAFER